MFKFKGKAFKRKGTHYVTLEVTSELPSRIESIDGREIHVRPRSISWEGEGEGQSISDPDLGRSDHIDKVESGERLVIKTKITEDELYDLHGAGTYDIHFGVVREFISWFEPFYTMSFTVKERECKKSPSSPG